jgi:UDP-N-acetylglucosamine transferase subunit ALG13
MIFVTVGSQLNFDRLIKRVDEWAGLHRDYKFIAQIGDSSYQPENMEYFNTISLDEYNKLFRDSKLVVAHAGMGTIITALDLGKNLILLPRLAKYGEHRNDHQLSTANYFKDHKLVNLANNEDEVVDLIETVDAAAVPNLTQEPSSEYTQLVSKLKSFVEQG